ncbi:MAG: glutamate--tRNA ligase [Actinomycetota bacterium]|nr:glutamate--tRNA ligase [Actinomycetota bacterium]
MAQVRTRIEPSPSGSIHVGNARTALYSWLVARQNHGAFVLRVADTDKSRVTEEGLQSVVEDLRWIGCDWDEGPEAGGDLGPYRQSERYDRYDAVAAGLVASGHAYPCYCTPDELDERRKKAQAERRTPGYDGRCRHLSADERAAFEAEGRAPALRFKVPEGVTVTFEDLVRGPISTETSQIPDFVIQRSDGSPTYMLAVTVDDHDMKITHIVRGEDLVSSTPRQLLIREALGMEERPVFAHLPLIVDEKGRPLSKRWGDVSVGGFRDQGFLPEAMVNYLALLGWSLDDKTNIFSVDELIERFSLDRVGKNPAAFDVTKLEWLNGHYIRSLPPAELADRLVPFCERAGISADTAAGRSILTQVAPLVSERMKRLDEVPPMVRFLFEPVEPDEKAAKVLSGQAGYLQAASEALESLDGWSHGAIEEALRALAERRGLKPKQAFQPLRAAVTGTLISPPLFESLELLGRPETLARLARARTGEGA